MKELSIEEKAKAYDQALKVLHKYDGANIMFSQDLKEEMFPELAESENEKIRKDLIIYLRSILSNKKYGDKFIEDWIAWLEKLPIEKLPFEMKTPEESLGIDSETYSKVVDECIYGEQKPVWSEEDEEIYKKVETAIDSYYAPFSRDVEEMSEWFKNLKDKIQPQSQWKPSEEQMDSLRYVTNFDYGGHKATLVSLYEQLKKL